MPVEVSVDRVVASAPSAADAGPGRRLLLIAEAGEFYPSGFIRLGIYREHFARAGFVARYASRVPERFLRAAHAPGRLLRGVLRLPFAAGAFARIGERMTAASEAALVAAAGEADVVYLSKVTSLDFVRRLRAAGRARLVLDFGDAIWLPRWSNRGVPELLTLVDAVTTDNELTAAYVRGFNPHCTVIPDCPQIEAFDRRRGQVARRHDPVRLGWIGSPGTAYNLYVAWEALERVFARHPDLELRLLGATHEKLPPFEKVRYSLLPVYNQRQMIDEALQMDIGLFPLQDVEACRVRGVLKATVYMSAGAPAVCSPVGQCADLIRDGENGMLAANTAQWEERLERLIADAPLRARLAARALDEVRARFTVDRSFALLRAVLEGQ